MFSVGCNWTSGSGGKVENVIKFTEARIGIQKDRGTYEHIDKRRTKSDLKKSIELSTQES